MIDHIKAIEIAAEEMRDYSPTEVFDFGEQYAVAFDLGEVPAPGIPSIVLVDKKTGKTDFLTIPPFENAQKLENATVLYTVN